jgi:general secretion pathway protein A
MVANNTSEPRRGLPLKAAQLTYGDRDPWKVVGDFFGVVEQPFGVTPDPKYLFLSRSHREALASLLYTVSASRGFAALIAPCGMGKTTILFEFLQRLRGEAHTAFLFRTQCDSRQFMRYLLLELGVSDGTNDLVAMHERLNEVLVREAAESRKVVVVVDEAQNLSEDVLETVRLLSNFETTSSKLIQIVLSGQPQLVSTLSRPSLLQLRQRISIWRDLAPLTSEEVASYIEHRLEVAGTPAAKIFDSRAQALIAHYSKGIPREINSICFGSMSSAFAMGRHQVSGEIVEEVIADLNLDRFTSAAKR